MSDLVEELVMVLMAEGPAEEANARRYAEQFVRRVAECYQPDARASVAVLVPPPNVKVHFREFL